MIHLDTAVSSLVIPVDIPTVPMAENTSNAVSVRWVTTGVFVAVDEIKAFGGKWMEGECFVR